MRDGKTQRRREKGHRWMDSESEAERKTNSDEYTSSRRGRKCQKNGERKVLEYRGVAEIRFEHRQGGK